MKASQGPMPVSAMTTIKPLTTRSSSGHSSTGKPTLERRVELDESEGSEDEWVEVDSADDVNESSESLMNLDVDQDVADEDKGMDVDLDTSRCFICDMKHETVESCTVHMHRQHGFFIPDIEYLKDANGFLTFLGLKVGLSPILLFTLVL